MLAAVDMPGISVPAPYYSARADDFIGETGRWHDAKERLCRGTLAANAWTSRDRNTQGGARRHRREPVSRVRRPTNRQPHGWGSCSPGRPCFSSNSRLGERRFNSHDFNQAWEYNHDLKNFHLCQPRCAGIVPVLVATESEDHEPTLPNPADDRSSADDLQC